MIGIAVAIGVLWLIYEVAKKRGQESVDEHNQKEKDNPRFKPATQSDANNFAKFVLLMCLAFGLFVLISLSQLGMQ